jgi:tRNA (Thr-GGU) A37 N-methylase
LWQRREGAAVPKARAPKARARKGDRDVSGRIGPIEAIDGTPVVDIKPVLDRRER